MPLQAKANNLVLENVPPELKDLNPMEIWLISLRIPFMKMVALPCGKQKAIHGPAVNIPADLRPVCDLLPRLPLQAQVVPMKLKRKLSYKGHYMYQYVQPAKVLLALEWLKKNNPLYKDVAIDQEWVKNADRDDSKLWEALSSQQCHQSSEEANSTQQYVSSDRNFSLLVSLAGDRGFIVRNVPGDGHCLFHSVQMQLESLGIHLEHKAMREQLVEYLEDNPYTHKGSCHLRTFLADPVCSAQERNVGKDCDTEPADDEDLFISSIADIDTQQQVRWCKYLSKLNSNAWGDHIALQGLADMLHVDIHIIATSDPDMETIKSYHPTIGTLHIGLIGQLHYVSLHRITPHLESADEVSVQALQVELGATQHQLLNRPALSPPEVSQEQVDQEQAEDEESYQHQAQLRGLSYDTMMHREDTNDSTSNVFSVVPGEGQKPIHILTDESFEEMCNPTKYPTGKFGLMANREKKLTIRK